MAVVVCVIWLDRPIAVLAYEWFGRHRAVRRLAGRQLLGPLVVLAFAVLFGAVDSGAAIYDNQCGRGRSSRSPSGEPLKGWLEDLADQAECATTKSPASRRFVALSTAKLKEWLTADLSMLDLLVIQIDGLRVGDHVLVAAIGIDGAGPNTSWRWPWGRRKMPPWSNMWPT